MDEERKNKVNISIKYKQQNVSCKWFVCVAVNDFVVTFSNELLMDFESAETIVQRPKPSYDLSQTDLL